MIRSPVRNRLRPATVGRWERFLDRSPLQPLFNWRAGRELAVIAYHGVDDPESFRRHLDHLRTHCRPVALDEVSSAINGRSGLPRRAVLITFDDADRTLIEHGAGLMKERGVPGVAFVVAGHLDGERPFWWKEVDGLMSAGGSAPGMEALPAAEMVRRMKRMPEEGRTSALDHLRRTARGPVAASPQLRSSDLPSLRTAGIDIGNHTMSHPILPRCSNQQVVREVTEAHSVLTRASGGEPRAFAYPNGDWDRRAERCLEEFGYETAFLFDHALTPTPIAHRLRISRVRVDSTASIERLRLILSGFHPAIHRLRRRLSMGSVR
jgi:peptidoglycan/xylan/chitin deacetylase (PgdA/CDA1 family)